MRPALAVPAFVALALAAVPVLATPPVVPGVPPSPLAPIRPAPSFVSQSFRCPDTGNLVSVGDSAYEVRVRCRVPDDAFTMTEYRTVSRTVTSAGGVSTTRGAGGVGTETTVQDTLAVPVDVWTYDFGPNRFMQILRFEGGRLVSIVDGERGTVRGAK